MSTPPEPPGYGTPVPPQHNPYAQDSPYGPQAYYPPGAPQQPPGIPPQPGAPRSGGGAGRAVLWAMLGALVASALWGGGVLLMRDSGATADLRGYKVKSDLCDAADLSAFKPGYLPSSTHTAWTAKGAGLDQMTCNESMDGAGSTGSSDAYLDIYVELNKKTDPKPEFADLWLGYKQHADEKYAVTPVEGYGDEAYLVTADSAASDSGERYVTLSVRDGWMTYYMTWTQFVSSSSTGSAAPATVDQVTQWVEIATRATLAKLKK